jgi:hypothetical protein
MKRLLTIVAISAVVPFFGTAQAEEFPAWSYSQVCNTSELHCPRYEAHARGKVSGVWPTLPPEVRKQCLDEIRALQPSYRLLHNCLANAMQELLKGQNRRALDG